MKRRWLAVLILAVPLCHAKRAKTVEPTALDRYIQEAMASAGPPGSTASAGSLWKAGALFGDLAGDVRAGQVNDLVTILVYERASAVARGATNTARKSDAKYSVSALAGPIPATGALANMAGASGESQLQGQGSTSRETTLTTTLSARVTHVLPNGYLVVEGVRDLLVNSERQAITVRGVIRPLDLGPGNTVRSDRVAQLEVKVSGKGVVEDSIRRPMFLYRLLMGILPF